MKRTAFLFGMVMALGAATVPLTRGQASTSGTNASAHSANVVQAPQPAENAAVAVASSKVPSNPICATPTSAAANVNTDCEGIAPHNETSIAVNPTNPLNIVGSANDYQLVLNSGGFVYETIYSRAHVTFDGGQTWTTHPIYFPGYVATGDPSVKFDGAGHVYLATLGFGFSQGASPGITNPDILVAHSADGGKTWSAPVRVASGSGNSGSVGIFHDKEYLAAWGNGNVIAAWTKFVLGQRGSFIEAPIVDSVSHDGGQTWTTPTEISGSAPFCAGSPGTPNTPNACNNDEFAVPVVDAGGGIEVAFESNGSNTTFRNNYLVVRVDPSTGQRIAGPFPAISLVDGATDYPIDAEGRQTYHDSQFRSNSAGSLAADPTNSQHLAIAFSDMRNSVLPAPADPYSAVTNSDVSVIQSFNGGVTWSAPASIAVPGDQFQPWAVYDATGKLRVGYFDRSYDPANHLYGYTLATETLPGSFAFTTTQLTTALSDPTQGDRWFSGLTVNSAFPHPTAFLGDYSNIATTPSGGVVAYWTDMRNRVCFTVRCGAGEDAEFAASS